MRNVKKDAPRPERKPLGTARYVDEAASAGRPITIRIDDRPPLVVRDAQGYQKLWELVDDVETAEAIAEALEQSRRGEGRPAREFFAGLRRKHGIPDD